MPRVAVGLEVALAQGHPWLQRARFGLLANQASVDAGFRGADELVAARWPGQLRALFGPQHGFASAQQDDMVETPHARDPRAGVPVHSLYADVRQPSAAMLQDLDLLVVDLQDVGTRVYTFAWTVVLCLEACAARRVRVLVLDRPNPLGGVAVEGARLDPAFASFVGLRPIPMRHALTLAELARWCNAGIGAELDVVPMAGWSRALHWTDTGRAWLPPSPNLPRVEGADVYPGQVLLEGTNLSEGRGTTTPFEVCGAPFVEPHRWRDALAELALPGVVFRPVRFEPTFQKWRGQECGGLFLHVTDRAAFRPYRTTLALLWTAKRLWPGSFAWRPPPYEYETVKPPIDVLTGSAQVRAAIDGERPFDELDAHAREPAGWRAELPRVALYG
jgi:uncharacterized protein YbbC (DUF1343 family)